ncbi:MAG: ABC transporter ATP-binding protein [Dethiobacteraceae bacterium]|jgi:NitT/TauT family transport system ATP-binding protein
MMIIMENIAKSFGELEIFKDINLAIGEGEFVSLIGPSGCGKSTLISMIAGLEEPTSGRVLVDGEIVTDTDPKRMMVFQTPALFPWMTVYQNVAFGLKNFCHDQGKIERQVNQMLKRVYLSKYKDYYPHQLSGGMKQRVAIARSMVMNPRVLLMDEPFSALDEQTRILLHHELQQLWLETGKTVLFVTHNLREAVKLSTRVIILGTRPGRIVGEMKINLPYPRHPDHPELFAKEKALYSKLKVEMEKVVKEELGNDYEFEKGHLPAEYFNTWGGGI